jgi:hypothetical protein
MSAESVSKSESVSESEKKFCGSETESEKKVFGSATLMYIVQYCYGFEKLLAI